MTIKTRKRSSSTTPFGWQDHPDNPHLLMENAQEQEALDYVKERAHSLSLRQAASILKARTGRQVTPSGIKMLLERKY